MEKKLFGVCGLECSKCPAYIALKTNDDALREQTAIEWSERYDHPFTREMINCVGCLKKKGPQCGFCTICPMRTCAFKKKHKGCFSCSELEECSILDEMEAQTKASFRQMSRDRKNEK